MAAIVEVALRVSILDEDGVNNFERTTRFPPGSGGSGKREPVTLSVGWNAFTVPGGAKALIIIPASTAASLTLKGASGDATGVAIVPASNPTGQPLLVSLGTSPTIGILNGGSATTAQLIWL
jgi:hypothetical protein